MTGKTETSYAVESNVKVKKDNYFIWLWKQMKGWPIQNYCLFWFSFGLQVMLLGSNPITTVSIITFIATTLGVLTILSINAVKSVNGWLGLLSSLCFIYVGYKAQNYLSMFEQAAYILTLDLPVLIAVKSWNDDTKNHLKKFNWKNWLVSIVFTLAVWGISAFLIGKLTNDPRPIYDALAFSISLTGGIVCFMRYNNQYFWWLASGLAQWILWMITWKQGDVTVAMVINSTVYIMNDFLAFTVSPWFNHGRKKHGLKTIK